MIQTYLFLLSNNYYIIHLYCFIKLYLLHVDKVENAKIIN